MEAISGIFEAAQKAGRTVYSVEFCPPRTPERAVKFAQAAQAAKNAGVHFCSITYGAGGSTQCETLECALQLKNTYGLTVMPHLTCVEHTEETLRSRLAGFANAGLHNIMALRGDTPRGATHFAFHVQGTLAYGNELVQLIREEFPKLCIGVAGYPEMHPESENEAEDIAYLKQKVDAGASFITTQLFFNNAHYFNFKQACEAAGITVPIVAGILPATSLAQVKRFAKFSYADVPEALMNQLTKAKEDSAASAEIGLAWAKTQMDELAQRGAPGIHLYALNNATLIDTLLG